MLKNNKAVVRNVIALSLPIAVQNVFSTAVSSADVIMVGMIGQDSLSAVLFMGFAQVAETVMKAVKQVRISTMIGTTALIFNWVFIFGLFGIPKMGVTGAA